MTASALARRLGQIRRLARLTPFETETEQGRSDERHRRMMLSSIASAVAKAISILTALISVPLTLNYLGVERYGMWLTLSSFITILSFADLGLGNGLLSQIADAHGRNDRRAMQRAITSAFGMLTAISASLLAAFALAYSSIPWFRIFNVATPLAKAEAGPAIAVFAICFAIAIPAAIVQKVQIGLQDSFIPSLWNCLSSLIALGGIIAVTQFGLGLPWLVLALTGAPLLAAISNSIAFFIGQRPDLAPQPAAFSIAAAISMARAGGLFLILQIVAAASYASDPLVISHVLGANAVPQYAVPERMFSLVGMVVAMGLAPLWPAYGEAISRSDHGWARRTLLRSIGLAAGAAAIGSTIVALLGPTLLHAWVGSAVQASPILLLGLALWRVLEAGGNAVSMFLNGSRVILFQVGTAITTGIVILTLKFVLVSQMGVAGTVWATIIGFSIVTIPAVALFFICYEKPLRKTKEQS